MPVAVTGTSLTESADCSAGLCSTGVQSELGTAYSSGDTIGVALDLDNGTVSYYDNNVLMTTITLSAIFTNYSAGQAVYAAQSLYTNGNTTIANFGATALTYTPPAGYCAGLANVCVR